MTSNQDQTNFYNQGYLKGLGVGMMKSTPNPILKIPTPNRLEFGVGMMKSKPRAIINCDIPTPTSTTDLMWANRAAKIKAKISVEDFDYLKGFASNKIIDVDDPGLAKIKGKISEEDVAGFANSNSNSRSVMGNPGHPNVVGFFDNKVGTICVIM